MSQKVQLRLGIVAIAAVLLVGIVLAHSKPPTSSSTPPAASHSSAYGEEAAEVADFTDCRAIQARFDGWYRNRHDFDIGVASDSMDADYDRQDELGCFAD